MIWFQLVETAYTFQRLLRDGITRAENVVNSWEPEYSDLADAVRDLADWIDAVRHAVREERHGE